MDDPQYVDDPFEEETEEKKQPKKLFGSTDLQKQALRATGRTAFKDNRELKKFTELEAKAIGDDPESRVWAAWIADRIKIAVGLNTKSGRIIMPMPNLIAAIANDVKRRPWFTDNREKVLRKPSVLQLGEKLGVQPGLQEMIDEMKTRPKNE